MKFLVAYYDTNGVGRLPEARHLFLTEAEAQARIVEIESQHTKPHKVDYRFIPFDGSKLEAMKHHGIAT